MDLTLWCHQTKLEQLGNARTKLRFSHIGIGSVNGALNGKLVKLNGPFSKPCFITQMANHQYSIHSLVLVIIIIISSSSSTSTSTTTTTTTTTTNVPSFIPSYAQYQRVVFSRGPYIFVDCHGMCLQ